MKNKKENDYFALFRQAVGYACQAADQLHGVLQNYQPAELSGQIETMHQVEHQADEAKHRMMACLAGEFLPPIDREDIMELAGTIDDVTDAIEDVLLRLYMYDVQLPRRQAVEFAAIVQACCTALVAIMEEFPNFRRSKILGERIIEVNRLEEEGDALYAQAVRGLYTSDASPVQLIVWTELFSRLEKCCDACEHVGDVVARVILKNS